MLKQWFNEQSGHTYWLVSHIAIDMLSEQGARFIQEQGQPLFCGDMFQSVMELSPWLVPVDAGLLQELDEAFFTGTGLLSHAPFDELLAHLRSLLIVGYEGEEVVWRYYEPSVLRPMLFRFDKADIQSFLGNIERLVIRDDTDFYVWEHTGDLPFQLQAGPWLKLKPEYFSQEENHALICANLESWLWQRYQPQLDQHVESGTQIKQQIMNYLQTENLSLTHRVVMAAVDLVYGAVLLGDDRVKRLLAYISDEETNYALTYTLEKINKEIM